MQKTFCKWLFIMLIICSSSIAQKPRCPMRQVTINPNMINKFYKTSSLNIVIPVAFHIIHATNGTGNISSSIIEHQINILNNAFTNTGISFYLLSIDRKENNNWFYNMSAQWPVSQDEINLKLELAISPQNVLNIYTLSIESGELGWTHYPWDFSENSYLHGIVLKYTTLPGCGEQIDGYIYDEGDTVIHEIGHYLGLFEIFDYDSCEGPGDYVDDTPHEVYNFPLSFQCINNRDTCPEKEGYDLIHNYMNYTDDVCMNEFTEGQIERMEMIILQYKQSLGFTPVISGIIDVNTEWYNIQLGGNVTIPANVTLAIKSGTTLNLNTYSIISTGGTITLQSGSTIVGLRATTCNPWPYIKGLYSNIQSAVNNWQSGNEIWLESGTFSENISISGKDNIYFTGIGPSSSINGVITVSNSDFAYIGNISSNELLINNSVLPTLRDVFVLEKYDDGVFTAYNSSYCDIDGLNMDGYYRDGAYFIGSDGEITSNSSFGTNFSNFDNATDFSSYSDFEIHDAYFCGNSTDINIEPGSSVYTEGCTFSGSCSLRKTAASEMSKPNIQNNFIPNSFRKLSGLFHELGSLIRDERSKNKNMSKEKYQAEMKKLIEEGKSFILENADSEYSKTAIKLLVSSFKLFEDYEGMKSFLNEILSNKNLSSLHGNAKRSIIDYHLNKHNYTLALSTADEILSTKNNTDLMSDILLTKGLTYQYAMDKADEAVKQYEKVLSDYPDTKLSKLAKKQLKNLGKEVKELPKSEIWEDLNELSINNYPNPFNPTTVISYQLPEAGLVSIKVYDILGRELTTLVEEFKNAGKHSITWNGNNFASGIYFYRINFNNQTLNKKMLLVK